MIAFRTVIMQAEFNYSGNIITEDAILKAIEKFQKTPLTLGNTELIIGTIDKLEYNKKTKEVTALIILKADLNIMFDNKNSLIVPEGKRILETVIKAAQLLM